MVCRIQLTSVTTAIRSQRRICSTPTLEILPHGALFDAGKISIDLIIQPHLFMLLECTLNGGHENGFIVAFGHVPLACEGNDIKRKV